MTVLAVQPNLTEQVHEAVLSEIAAGKLKPGERVIQEQLAEALGVSRQPVQQALLLLRKQGVLRDAPCPTTFVCVPSLSESAIDFRPATPRSLAPPGTRPRPRKSFPAGPSMD